jgi:hypothetical protein
MSKRLYLVDLQDIPPHLPKNHSTLVEIGRKGTDFFD